MRKLLFAASAIGALILGVSDYVAAQDKPVIATVVKISGIPWFNRMEVGVKAFQDANPDVVTSESGPATADAAQQLQIIEDLIARGVNAGPQAARKKYFHAPPGEVALGCIQLRS